MIARGPIHLFEIGYKIYKAQDCPLAKAQNTLNSLFIIIAEICIYDPHEKMRYNGLDTQWETGEIQNKEKGIKLIWAIETSLTENHIYGSADPKSMLAIGQVVLTLMKECPCPSLFGSTLYLTRLRTWA